MMRDHKAIALQSFPISLAGRVQQLVGFLESLDSARGPKEHAGEVLSVGIAIRGIDLANTFRC